MERIINGMNSEIDRGVYELAMADITGKLQGN